MITIDVHVLYTVQLITLDSSEALMLRLAGGSTPREGRVEIFFGDSWGSVCDDSWDLTDASIVCQQLGYGFAVEAVVMEEGAPPRFGEGIFKISYALTY